LTGETITVRACGSEDVDAVLGLWAADRSPHASTVDRREDVERLLADSPGALIVAEDGGRVVGAVIAGWDGWRGNLYRLVVDPGHRRRGVGRLLVRAAEDHLAGRGGRRVTALVAFDDEDAGAFWDAAGYPRDAEIGRRVRNL
jgi:ribosomal protein S18 acetylase RimI-like enzyme